LAFMLVCAVAEVTCCRRTLKSSARPGFKPFKLVSQRLIIRVLQWTAWYVVVKNLTLSSSYCTYCCWLVFVRNELPCIFQVLCHKMNRCPECLFAIGPFVIRKRVVKG